MGLSGWLRTLAVGAVTIALITSCSSGSKAPRAAAAAHTAATSTSTTAAPATTTLSPEEAVLAGYRASWDDYLAVGMHPDPADPRLAAHATGAQLVQIRRYFADYQARGLVQRGTVDLAPRVVAVAGATATVRDCVLSHLEDVDAKTGQVRSVDPPVRKLGEASMVLESGVWKVSGNTDKGNGCTSA